MKAILAAGAAIGAAILFGQTQVERARAVQSTPAPERRLSWNEYERSFGPPAAQSRPAVQRVQQAEPVPAAPSLDVVDAHWMALTMWGEARGDGEAGMRAVGHVIDNRRRATAANPRFVTDTVSEAWQFSCWNRGDPNLAAMLNIESLPQDSRDYRLWRLARRLADEIMSGGSLDPTDGALFYHSDSVAPRWSEGRNPDRQIGRHLFFRRANGA
ncbi:MAG TPA: cell wall hydrolase [Allosphingosinicella sp.]